MKQRLRIQRNYINIERKLTQFYSHAKALYTRLTTRDQRRAKLLIMLYPLGLLIWFLISLCIIRITYQIYPRPTHYECVALCCWEGCGSGVIQSKILRTKLFVFVQKFQLPALVSRNISIVLPMIVRRIFNFYQFKAMAIFLII